MRDGDAVIGSPSSEVPGVELIRPIGKGAYGEVWMGRNTVTHRLIAVKLVRLSSPAGFSGASRELSALRREARRRTTSPHLVEIQHVGQTDEHLYYFMELADAVDERPPSAASSYEPLTLSALIKNGSIPTPDCIRWAQQLLEGLSALHESGFTHRDVKPSNCLIMGGVLKLADYGLLAESDGSTSILGTPKYMPPDRKMDPQADVYAAGLVIYEMLSGMSAEEFPSWSSQRLCEIRTSAGRALNRVMLKACERDPSKRYPNATEMFRAIHTLLVPAPSTIKFHRRSVVLGGVLTLIAAVIASISVLSIEPTSVDVDFITKPFEAEIFLDGERLVGPKGDPYRTPCTIPELPARPTHIVFKRLGCIDLDLGTVDLATTRSVDAAFTIEAPAGSN